MQRACARFPGFEPCSATLQHTSFISFTRAASSASDIASMRRCVSITALFCALRMSPAAGEVLHSPPAARNAALD